MAKKPRRCEVCGCTEGRACSGGCAWDPNYEDDVCTRCTGAEPYRAEPIVPGNGGRARWIVVGPGTSKFALPPVPLTIKREQAEQLAQAFNHAFTLGTGLGHVQAEQRQQEKGSVR